MIRPGRSGVAASYYSGAFSGSCPLPRLTAFTALLLFTPPAGLSAQDGSNVAAAVRSITPRDVQARINLLAADSMRGRYTPSPELEEAANYIAGQFRSFGLKPGGDAGGYLQRYSVDQVLADTAKARVAIDGGPIWRLGHEVMYQYRSGLPAGPVSGPVVVVTGTPPPPPADPGVKGAIVIAVAPAAAAGAPARQANAALMPLIRGGAAAVIVALNAPDSGWAMMGRLQSRPTSELSWEPSALPPVLIVRDPAIAPVLA